MVSLSPRWSICSLQSVQQATNVTAKVGYRSGKPPSDRRAYRKRLALLGQGGGRRHQGRSLGGDGPPVGAVDGGPASAGADHRAVQRPQAAGPDRPRTAPGGGHLAHRSGGAGPRFRRFDRGRPAQALRAQVLTGSFPQFVYILWIQVVGDTISAAGELGH